MLNKILCFFFLASLAETYEFKQVTVYSEPGFFGEAFLYFAQFIAREINDLPAAGANQVMVVAWGTNCVAVAATASMEFTDKSQLGKYLKGAVDGYKPNIGVVLTHLLIYCSRSKMVPGGGNCPYHYPSLRGELIAMLLQCSCYFSLRKPHFKSQMKIIIIYTILKYPLLSIVFTGLFINLFMSLFSNLFTHPRIVSGGEAPKPPSLFDDMTVMFQIYNQFSLPYEGRE